MFMLHVHVGSPVYQVEMLALARFSEKKLALRKLMILVYLNCFTRSECKTLWGEHSSICKQRNQGETKR